MKQAQQSEHKQDDRKPWPMSWVLIVILIYIALQTAYFLFFTD